MTFIYLHNDQYEVDYKCNVLKFEVIFFHKESKPGLVSNIILQGYLLLGENAYWALHEISTENLFSNL